MVGAYVCMYVCMVRVCTYYTYSLITLLSRFHAAERLIRRRRFNIDPPVSYPPRRQLLTRSDRPTSNAVCRFFLVFLIFCWLFLRTVISCIGTSTRPSADVWVHDIVTVVNQQQTHIISGFVNRDHINPSVKRCGGGYRRQDRRGRWSERCLLSSHSGTFFRSWSYLLRPINVKSTIVRRRAVSTYRPSKFTESVEGGIGETDTRRKILYEISNNICKKFYSTHR